jgi:hypothetical protein
VVQLGTKKPEGEEEEEKKGSIEEEDMDDPDAAPKESPKKEKKEAKGPLVLSGFVRGESEVDGKPAILDVPVGKGRVILFAFNPLHRYLNLSDFRFAYNAILNWNDLPQ